MNLDEWIKKRVPYDDIVMYTCTIVLLGRWYTPKKNFGIFDLLS